MDTDMSVFLVTMSVFMVHMVSVHGHMVSVQCQCHRCEFSVSLA